MTKKMLSVAAAVTFGMSLVACNNDRVIECDRGDQIELDSDCGYWRDGQFIWYNWVVKGQDSFSPVGFELIPDDETAPQENSGPKLKKKSKTAYH